ncbi:hypothetical protein L2E82_36238 [Cichorium intybus]|uniref:Uncharacterized protein n=1 Tax=Cichorium intybus TaxID=13427 RepID=A0ACB9BR34_CICIN|nr:hypothetical protein L2E82_36238 [Cichorium intybus]
MDYLELSLLNQYCYCKGYKMIGSFLTRGLVMVFGYAYPAYECFKSVEKNKPDIEQLRFWCQYWILVAVLTVCERIGDTFVSWVPMYSEAKLAFYIYLWYPKTKGTIYVYDSFFRPYISKHETDIDRNLMELRTRAGDYVVLYWQRAASYGQTRIFDVLQYVASQSTPNPRSTQPPQTARPRPPTPNRRGPPPSQQEPKEPPSPVSTSSSSSPQPDDPTTNHRPQPPPTAQKATSSQSLAVVAPPETADDMEVVEPEPSVLSNPNSNTQVKDTLMEEPVRVYTRARSRKNNVVNVE